MAFLPITNGFSFFPHPRYAGALPAGAKVGQQQAEWSTRGREIARMAEEALERGEFQDAMDNARNAGKCFAAAGDGPRAAVAEAAGWRAEAAAPGIGPAR